MRDILDEIFINPHDGTTVMNILVAASYQQNELSGWTPEVEAFAQTLCLAFGFAPETVLPSGRLSVREASVLVYPAAPMLEEQSNDRP